MGYDDESLPIAALMILLLLLWALVAAPILGLVVRAMERLRPEV